MTVKNQTIIDRWLRNQVSQNVNLSTDGHYLRSYQDIIGKTLENGAKIIVDKTAPAGGFRSVTTSRHVNMCKVTCDAIENPVTGALEIIPMRRINKL